MKTKNICFLFISIIFITSLIAILPVIANADSEYDTFGIDINSISVSNNNATIGDKVKVTFNVKEGEEVTAKYISIYYNKPITGQHTEYFALKYNYNTNKFEYELTIDNNWQNGLYKIDYIVINDGANSELIYNSQTNSGYSTVNNYVDFGNGNFTVYGTTADTEFPVIDGASVTVSKQKVVIGDEIEYSVKITDNVEVSGASIELRSENGKFIGTRLYYDSYTRLFKGTINITEEMQAGPWFIYYIYASDTNKNSILLYNSKYSLIGESAYNFTSKTIYNYKQYTIPELTPNSLSIDNTAATQNESVHISLEAMDRFGIDNVMIYFRREGENDLYAAEAVYSRTKSTLGSDYYQYQYNEYTATIEFDEYGYNGTWKIDRIELNSTEGVKNTIYNQEFYDEDNVMDFSLIDFITYGLIEDDENPTIDNFSITKQMIMLGENTTLNVVANDLSSGIKKVIANYTLPNGTTNDYILEPQGYSVYSYKFSFDDCNLAGKYTINYLLAEDYSGKTVMLNENISNLDFYLNSGLHIIAPGLFLKKTTSYQMQAVLDDSLKNEGVKWYSSNKSIASINETTGMMSTKSSDGTFYITAVSVKNPDIFEKIQLRISGAAVKVGETVSLGNSSYTSYETVQWRIGDETILQNTGSSGYTAINSNYKHFLYVKGLKEGTTTLTMLTPSGDVIASTTVYVYNTITSMTTETKELILEKNESQKIDVNIQPSDVSANLREYYFSSENSNIATVDNLGNVKALGAGSTNIKIYSKYNGLVITIPVTVVVYTSNIVTNTEEIKLNEENKTYQIEYSIEPEDATNKNVSFSCDDETIVEVNQSGLVTALKNGTTTIKIETEDGKQEKNIPVTVSGLRKDIRELNFEELNNVTYTGEEINPDIIVFDGEYQLEKDIDFEISIINNLNVGDATVTITGINKYKGEKVLSFHINEADIQYYSSDVEMEYDGEGHGIALNLINPLDARILYADQNEEYTIEEMPTYTEPGEYIIKFQISKENYNTVESYNKIFIYRNIESVTLSESEIYMEVNENWVLQATILPENNTDNKHLIWESENPYIAYVRGNGDVIAVSAGETIITVTTSNGKQASCNVIVTNHMNFDDVSELNWFYNSVEYVYKRKIITGYTDSIFAPFANLTREQLVNILWRIEGRPDGSELENKFSDVPDESWYTDAIKWASANEIVKGYGETTKFGVGDNIIRQDLAIMLSNYAKYKGKYVEPTTNLNNFADKENVSGYAEEAIMWASENQIISGNALSDGVRTIEPLANAMRCEAAVMLMRFCENILE